MDFDGNSPLNCGHRKERQAEDHLKAERFDSAVESLKHANRHFKEALSLTSDPKAREAIVCQIERSQQQIFVVQNKKKQVIQNMEDMMKKRESQEDHPQVKTDKTTAKKEGNGIDTRIIRAMEEHDSLLQVLMDKHTIKETNTSISESVKSGSKIAKGDKTIIEELKTSNEHLRLLITQLVSELELLQQENQMLKKQSKREEGACPLPQLPPLDTPKLFY